MTQEVIEVAHAAKAHVVTGVCNSVGAISPMLGGGLGNLVALYGMAVDNMLSARLVTATGNIITVSAEENADLWWGLRGAGHNFGIVSQLTVKAHEQVNGGVHWAGTIAFPGTEENVVRVVEGLNALGLGDGKPMGCTMVWAKVPPEFQVCAFFFLPFSSLLTQEFPSRQSSSMSGTPARLKLQMPPSPPSFLSTQS